MTGVNGTLFVSGYGEELVEPDECKARVTIISERATALNPYELAIVCHTAVEAERDIA